jgi:hypothetical protein
MSKLLMLVVVKGYTLQFQTESSGKGFTLHAVDHAAGGARDTPCTSTDGCWWCYSWYMMLKNITKCRNAGEKLVWHRHFYWWSTAIWPCQCDERDRRLFFAPY